MVPEEEKVDKEDKDYKPHSSLAKATEKHRKSKHFEKEVCYFRLCPPVVFFKIS